MAVAFQLGIDNTSPTITYSPFTPNTIARNATSGWTPYYTNIGFPLISGRVGDGTSLQISSQNGSFFSITWSGTGIDLYGNATNAAFRVNLDRSVSGSSGTALVDSGSNLLASFSNLRLDTYTVTLTANTQSSPSSFIAFDRAVITSAVEVNLDDVTVHSETVDDATIAYKGGWSYQQSPTADGFFHVSTRLGDSAQLSFNGTAISVFGLRDPTAGHYNITLDGETTQYNAQSVWKEGAVLFYTTGLDPERTHSLIITNAEDHLLSIGYVNTTLVSGHPTPTSDTGIPKGAIAGIVVGIFLGVVVFPILGFVLWRRRRRKGRRRNFTFIEPSIHKGFDITEVLDIQPGGLGHRRKSPSPTQSPVSEVSLDLFPVTIPQNTYTLPRASPPTFPRSPTTSSPSTTQQLRDISGRGVVHPPEAIDQHLSVHIPCPPQVDLEKSPSPALNRRSTVPKPSGPRPQSYRSSTCDPRTSAFMPLAEALTDPTPIKGKGRLEPPEPSEPEMQQVNEGERTTIYSFLDMNSYSGPPSTIDGVGQSQNVNRPVSHANIDSFRHSLVTGANSIRSRRDSDKRRESGASKPLSLSVVIQQPPALKYSPSSEPHPYSPYSTGHRQGRESLRPRTGEGVSPTESIPITTSEVSEIRFSHPGEIGEPSALLRRGSGSYLQSPSQPSMKAVSTASPIYQKLFGTLQGQVPQDGLLSKRRPLHRRVLSASTFNTPPRT